MRCRRADQVLDAPTLNWHLTSHVRWEAGYGYGGLDRFGLTGHTHFLQTRWQFQF